MATTSTSTTPQKTAPTAPPNRKPPAAPAPAAPPAAPPAATPTAPPAAPAAPAAPATSGFKSLDDDLTEFASKTTAKPSRRPKDEPKPPPPESAPPAEPGPAEASPAPEPAPPESPDDYLMGGIPKEADASADAAQKKPEDPAATGPLKAPELRAEYAKVKKRVGELEKELADLKAKGPEAKSVDESERKAFVDQIGELKKQLEQTTGALKTVAYEHSDEYKTKYEKPFVDAWQEGVQLVTSLTLTDQDGNTRKGTPEDFASIMREPNIEHAANLAQEMFGPNAFYVLAQRRDLERLHNQRVKALEEYRTHLSEREKIQSENAKKEQEQREARRVQNTTLFRKYNADAASKYPQFFAPIPGDDEGNALLAQGYHDADLAFGGAPDLTDERRVQLHSAIRNRAAAFGRLVHQLKAKEARISELQKELEEIKGSTPGAGQVGRQEQTQKYLTADEEFELAAKKFR